VSGAFELESPDEATVAAYLANRLDAPRAEAFEEYCLRHPEFARRVELDLSLKTGLAQMLESDRKGRARPGRRAMVAIAAGLVLAVGCGLVFFAREHSGGLVAYRTVTEVPAQILTGPRISITLIRLREGSSVHRIVAPQGAGMLTVRVLPDSPPGAQGYAIAVVPESAVIAKPVTVDGLRVGADGYIRIYLPVAALVGRTLKVTVTPSPSSGGEPLSFRLQVAYPQNTPAVTP
jgi:hypothetical protein